MNTTVQRYQKLGTLIHAPAKTTSRNLKTAIALAVHFGPAGDCGLPVLSLVLWDTEIGTGYVISIPPIVTMECFSTLNVCVREKTSMPRHVTRALVSPGRPGQNGPSAPTYVGEVAGIGNGNAHPMELVLD